MEKPVAYDAYEQMADAYASRVATKPHNAFYDRPAVLSLVPEVAGKAVLDAGCGTGAYAQELLALGAKVTGVEVSPRMLAHARTLLGDAVEWHEADLREPMPFLRDASFDVVVCPLVLDYVEDLAPIFREFRRVLRAGGVLVFSMQHPFANFEYYKLKSYFPTERKGCDWHGFGKKVYVPSYCRPLQEIVNPLIESGFILDRILEPKPTPEFKVADPKHYDELLRLPGFICLRALKP